jgi:hypothetical protein
MSIPAVSNETKADLAISVRRRVQTVQTVDGTMDGLGQEVN